MPTTRNSIIKYGLAAINDALVTISLLIKRTVAMGTQMQCQMQKQV